MHASQPLAPIPQPPATLFAGHLFALSASTPIQDMWRLARELGPIYRLNIRQRVIVVVSGYALVNELSDETRFDKSIRGALGLVRRFSGDGLFTARTDEPNWSRAHNILLPNFGQRAMQRYHPMMLDIAQQLMLKWERGNRDEDIDVARDMTSLTVDTIGLSGFNYRFNSFYHDTAHPFVGAMAEALGLTMDELRDVPLEGRLRQHRKRRLHQDIETMNATVDRIIAERRASGEDQADQTDLLRSMLDGVDRKTGERLDDVNIRYQVITFLIAGHETTSGLLSFAIYALLRHPDVLAKAYAEVDRVLGPDPSVLPTYTQVTQLRYVQQILQEALRLWPTAPAFSLYPYSDTLLGGKYRIAKHYNCTVLLPMLHRDPSVWGEHAEVFNPDNFTPEAQATRPANAYKPFGNGRRACIGRQFAMQEATLVLGMLLQRFTLIDHTRYQLRIKESLTLKPDGFTIRLRPRPLREWPTPSVVVGTAPATTPQAPEAPTAAVPAHATPLLVLYGSNMGTAEELARRLARDAEDNGFVVQIASLDAHAGRLPTGLLAIVTSSYNGLPPDNAVTFCDWLRHGELAADACAGVTYTVFGCGNRDWAATFQAVPRFIDAQLAAHGARRLYPLGEGDTRDDFDGQFQQWYQPLRRTVAQELGIRLATPDPRSAPRYRIEVVAEQPRRPFVATFNAVPMTVLVNRELHRTDGAHASERSTRHLELALPSGLSYRAGDHLGVLPHNGAALVKRTTQRFGLDPDVAIQLHCTGNHSTFLPVEETIPLARLLGEYVELQDVATRSQLSMLLSYTDCPPERGRLAGLAEHESRYKEEVLVRRQSLLDILEDFPSCALPFEKYLELLPPLRPRYYSISSSPLVAPQQCSITVAVVAGAARSGRGTFAGVCSHYLRRQAVGDVVYAFVKDTKSAFRLPDDPTTPILMIGPGTGLAPFRGFLQERAALQAQGRVLGPALLFFGCRHPQQDFLYEEELRAFEAQGVTRLAVAFSRQAGQQTWYVQDAMYARRDEVWQWLEAGAVVYLCGDASRVAPDVRRMLTTIYSEQTGRNATEAAAWLQQMLASQRYLEDVWAAT